MIMGGGFWGESHYRRIFLPAAGFGFLLFCCSVFLLLCLSAYAGGRVLRFLILAELSFCLSLRDALLQLYIFFY
jgi:hypothetical protein